MILLLRIGADGQWQGDWQQGGGWWWWLWGPIMFILWGAITALIVWFAMRRNRRPEPSPLERARSIVAERYARGEIDTEEYQQRLDHLR